MSYTKKLTQLFSTIRSVFVIFGITLAVVSGLFIASRVHAASGTMALSGNAWSSNIGWISFGGAVQGGGAYGVDEDASGNLSGQAWSSNIGWIDFSGLTADASHPAPYVDFANGGAVMGWARACSAFANPTACTGALAGSWDGWIDLSDPTNGVPYGITQGTDCTWSGQAWGSTNIGWIDASGSGYGVTGSDSSICSKATASKNPVVNLSANPSTINSGDSSTLTWSSTNATSCTSSWTTSNATSGTKTVSPGGTTTYTVTCTNTYGSTNASATVTVAGNQPTVSFSANPTTINKGDSSTLTWSSTKATSCTGTGFSTGNAISGSVSTGALTSTQNYQVTCTGTGGSTIGAATVSVNPSNITLTATPSRIQEGATTNVKVSWSATSVTSCNLTDSGGYMTPKNNLTGSDLASSTPVSLSNPDTFTMSCSPGPVTRSTSVNIGPKFNQF